MLKTIVSLIILTVIHILLWIFPYKASMVSAQEYGSMENMQILLTALTSILFLVSHKKESSKSRKLFLLILGWLTFNFMIREIEINELSFEINPILIWLRHGLGYFIWSTVGWVYCFSQYLRIRQTINTLFLSWIKSSAGILMIAGGFFLFLSVPIDKGIFELSEFWTIFWEEVSELNGYILILLSSIISLRKTYHL